jgi:Retrotransposon gag protein
MFKEREDQKDVEPFIYDFRERLSLLGASDDVICRIFLTCLVGEAWEWYKMLSSGSIRSFDDFVDLFLERYNHIKVSRVTSDSLLDMKHDPTEKIKAYMNRFVSVYP